MGVSYYVDCRFLDFDWSFFFNTDPLGLVAIPKRSE